MPYASSLLKALDDAIRTDLISQRDWYESCIFWSTFAVVLGCAMEVPEVVYELWSALFAKKLVKPIRILASLGLGFVVLGVAGELTFEHSRSEYEELKEEFENILLVDAERQITLAQIQAGSAAASAKSAHEESDAAGMASRDALNIARAAARTVGGIKGEVDSAKSTADEAKDEVDGAKRDADAVNKEVKGARAELRVVEEFVSARHIVDSKPFERLKPFQKRKLSLISISGDEEARAFCIAVADRLKPVLGWKDPQNNGVESPAFVYPVCWTRGVGQMTTRR